MFIFSPSERYIYVRIAMIEYTCISDERDIDNMSNVNAFPPLWLIRVCSWLQMRLNSWLVAGIGLFWALIDAVLLAPVSPLAQFTQLWIFQYKVGIVIGVVIYFVLYGFIYLISGFEATPSISVRQRHYLRHMQIKYEPLTTRGIPEKLFPPSIHLDEVFIAPQLINERTQAGIDYPLRAEEISLWQQIFTQRKKRLPRELANPLAAHKQVGLAEFWQRLSRERPVAVIQGYPGMGKSTLMQRLTLHMARRCLHIADPRLPALSPALVPILIELKDYSKERKKALANNEELPVLAYLPKMLQKRTWQGKDPWPFLNKCLERGMCLVLFDGLDEAGDAETRKQVAREVNAFIEEQRNTPRERKTFNRFLITSRVAGYSPDAFPHAQPYRIAELTEEQMHELLDLWYNAVKKVESAADEAEKRMQRLHNAIKEHGPIFRLAENPLLLMLMAAMQKHSMQLPNERAALYDTITLTLLQYREKDKELDKDLPPIDEDVAVRRLGSLAYAMQSTDYIADEHTVKDLLSQTIREERKRGAAVIDPVGQQTEIDREAEITQEAEKFLTLVRERSNLFVQRTGEDFSFFHKSFQEYFTARFILNTIQHQRETEIDHLVKLARQSDDIWREPFLFAVGYQSAGRGRDQTVARDLLQQLVDASTQESDPKRRLHDLLLAAEALVEAKAQIFDETLEQQIAQELLTLYMEAQQQKESKDCESIERVLRLWLLTLLPGSNQSALLLIICANLQDFSHIALQRAVLTLLVMILALEDYPQPVYDTLIPLLLGLADLPALNQDYQPSPHTGVVDYTVADLALVALSQMGRHGPAGIVLKAVRQHFANEPEQLSLLARYSLEHQMLLTFAVVPQTEPLYQIYLKAVDRWLALQHLRARHPYRTIDEDLPECLAIHQELLAYAEEVRYPTTLHLLTMLHASSTHQDQPWQNIWQTVLFQQLAGNVPQPYVYYQENLLLWESLFPSQEHQKRMMELLMTDYIQGKKSSNHFAQRFLATISKDWRDLRDWSGFSSLREWRELRYWQDLGDLREDFDWRDSREWRDLRYWRDWRDLRDLRDLQERLPLRLLRDWRDLRDLRYWRGIFLDSKITEKTIQSLLAPDTIDVMNLSSILIGCLLSIQKTDKHGLAKTQQIVEAVRQALANPSTSEEGRERRKALIDILSYVPASTGDEIAFVRQLAENTTEQELQAALIVALEEAHPDQDALPALQAATASSDMQVAKAAQTALERVLTRQKREATLYY